MRSIDSGAVNDYLRGAAGCDISAKDFRPWHASVLALELLGRTPRPSIGELLNDVAGALRNTAAVCRRSYVHPKIIAACLSDAQSNVPRGARVRGLAVQERALLHFLEHAAKQLP